MTAKNFLEFFVKYPLTTRLAYAILLKLSTRQSLRDGLGKNSYEFFRKVIAPQKSLKKLLKKF